MALTSRQLRREEEEESVFITMTDLMISILFIVMLVLAYFATLLIDEAPDIRELQQQVETLRVENEDLRAEIVQLQAELETRIDQGDRLQALREDNRRLREELARLELENKRLQTEIDALQLENDALKTENTDLKEVIEDLRDRIKTLEAELKELRNQLETDPVETALKGISEDRNILLSRIEDRLIAAGIKVIVDEVSGVVRFGEDAIEFRSGSSTPDRRTTATMRKIAEILTEELTCYTLGANSAIADNCNPNNSVIEAVQIEGHTDSDGADIYNLNLSTRRATSTYEVFVKHRPELTDFLNANYLLDDVQGVDVVGQEVLSVSGYGETRPINFGTTQADKDGNRRIDMRFIMTTPKNVEEVERLKAAIQAAIETQGVQE